MRRLKRQGLAGHKEINRTNLTMDQILEGLKKDLVKQQLKLLNFRNTFPAFGFDGKLTIHNDQAHILKLQWENNSCKAVLTANLKEYSFEILATDESGKTYSL